MVQIAVALNRLWLTPIGSNAVKLRTSFPPTTTVDWWDRGHELLALCLLAVRWHCKATGLRDDALRTRHRGMERWLERSVTNLQLTFLLQKRAMVCEGAEMQRENRGREKQREFEDIQKESQRKHKQRTRDRHIIQTTRAAHMLSPRRAESFKNNFGWERLDD